jgi:DNA-binding CsgD family transcriptional regulator
MLSSATIYPSRLINSGYGHAKKVSTMSILADTTTPALRTAQTPTRGETGLRRVLIVVDVMLAFTDENELLEHLLPALLRAIPADSVMWWGSDRGRSSCHAEPPSLVTPERMAAFEAHRDADPLIVHVRRGSGTALRRSDLQNDYEFQRLGTYQPIYSALGIRRQLAMSLRPSAERRVSILFNRGDPDFTGHDVAVAEALRPRMERALRRFAPPNVRREAVSPREADVMDLLCRGLTDRQIATRLGISPRTVDKHLEHAYVKLGVRCRVQAAARWKA